MKIVIERDKCIGCGSCVATCPEHWKMGEDGKSFLIDSNLLPETGNQEKEIKEPGCTKDAVEGCPVQCIHIEK